MGTAFFPLDKELGVLAGGLTPHAQQCLIRLSAWMPFAHAAQLLDEVLGVQVSRASARRSTLRAGERLEEHQTEQAHPKAISQQEPEAGVGVQMVMSADGAFVPVVEGEWVEVKTLVIGEVKETADGDARGSSIYPQSFLFLADG